MDKNLQVYIDDLVKRHPILDKCSSDIEKAYLILEECFSSGHKLLIVGNGGSAADSDHIVGELMKGFKLSRKCSPDFADKLKSIDAERGVCLAAKLQGALPAITLTGNQSLYTAFSNDVADGGLYAFSQQVYGYGKQCDVLFAISTSGNSQNVLNAVVVAKALGLRVIGLTGKTGGELSASVDVTIKVPETETFLIQELHLPVYHCLCLMLEKHFFGDL